MLTSAGTPKWFLLLSFLLLKLVGSCNASFLGLLTSITLIIQSIFSHFQHVPQKPFCTSDNGSVAHPIFCVHTHSLKTSQLLEHLSQPCYCFYYPGSCLVLSSTCEEVQWWNEGAEIEEGGQECSLELCLFEGNLGSSQRTDLPQGDPLPTLLLHISHVCLEVQVQSSVLQEGGDLEVKWGGEIVWA